jgi:hypothetical protein
VDLRFAWDATGLANVVCDDFTVQRELRGLVLGQKHRLTGAVEVTTEGGRLRIDPVFEDRTVELRVDLADASWAEIEQTLRSQDTLGKCGLLLDPEAVLRALRELAARGIRVKLPDEAFRSFDLPARVEGDVTLAERTIGIAVKAARIDVEPDLLWLAARIEAEAPASPPRPLPAGSLPPRADSWVPSLGGHRDVEAKGGAAAGKAQAQARPQVEVEPPASRPPRGPRDVREVDEGGDGEPQRPDASH